MDVLESLLDYYEHPYVQKVLGVIEHALVQEKSNGTCPLGFICNETTMVNCTILRGVSLLYGFGDLHAGSYCPEEEDAYTNCPKVRFPTLYSSRERERES